MLVNTLALPRNNDWRSILRRAKWLLMQQYGAGHAVVDASGRAAAEHYQARAVAPAGPTTLVYDTYSDIDSTPIAAHVPNICPVGSAWANGLGTWVVFNNVARLIGNGNYAHATINSGVADCTISAKVANGAAATSAVYSNASGICVRWSDTNNFWGVVIQAFMDRFAIYERNAGVITVKVFTPVAIDVATQYLLSVVLNGTTITATLNGANTISYASATLNQAATYHGMIARVGNGNDNIDDFLITVP